MNTRRLLLTGIMLLSASGLRAASCCSVPPASTAATTPLPNNSLYYHSGVWQNQDGERLPLADFAGRPVLITMIFTHCVFACPRIVEDLETVQARLPSEVRQQVRIVLASFDSPRDTPERLREWAQQQQLGPEWSLLHGDDDAVRELAVMLDIAYLPQPDGSFAHGNRIVLLDAAGTPIANVEGLGTKPDAIVSAAVGLIAKHHP